ncbi:MAG TPA: hypothetical protein VGM39_26195 [Kofleriaceae bacterium]|jgi:hypothetical protein
MRAVSFLLLAACGSSAPTGPAPGAMAAPMIAAPTDPTDAIVAHVNGRPIYASCVQAQARASAVDAKAALDQCLSFELLAQEAEKRTLATAPDVIAATRAAIVNRLVEKGFEAKYQKPADFGPQLDKWLGENAWRMDRPELRASTYLRVQMDAKVAPDVDAQGKALAQQIYLQLKDQSGLMPADMGDVATEAGKTTKLTLVSASPPMQPASALDKAYADPLFAIPEVGRVSPPVRTKWGWDVILYTDGLPPLRQTREELAQSAFADLRRGLFPLWVNGIKKELGTKVEIEQDAVAKLEGEGAQ